jgi:D-alanyl-D-alanine carboxypeptidase (penicillin-binding protein 5/6)
VILDRKKGEVLFGKCETETRQIASLTKIMTAYCVLNLAENSGPTDLTSPFCDLNCSVKILKPVTQLEGTSAKLLEGDSLSIINLIYGMMLPSGNDAAQTLGIYFG